MAIPENVNTFAIGMNKIKKGTTRIEWMNNDAHPQAEPYIVKLHDIHIDTDYADWIADTRAVIALYR